MAMALKWGRKSWARATSFALLTMILPMLLAACGGSTATNTPSAASTTAATTNTFVAQKMRAKRG